jgi:glycogen debranching enzyme
MITSKTGDMLEEQHGLFENDTRFLSHYRAKICDADFEALTSSNTAHYSAGFYLTNSTIRSDSTEIPKEIFTIHRMRFIEHDVREEFSMKNVGETSYSFTLSFELDADFADLFDVKQRVFGKRPDISQRTEERASESAGKTARLLRENVSKNFIESENYFDFRFRDPGTGFSGDTLVWFSKKGRVEVRDGGIRQISFDLSLGPGEQFHLTISIAMLSAGEERPKRYTNEYFESMERKIARALETWEMTVPQLSTNWDELKHAFYQSLEDIASLRMSNPANPGCRWELPAAGCPWFMTLFGRDTLITSYQTMICGHGLAKGTLDALASYQAQIDDAERDAEPGKILHELRFGDYAARSQRYPYYGTVDATPLFLILISELYRWKGEDGAKWIDNYRANTMRALEWIDEYGDLDGDGFIEYRRRSKEGLENQCWKDSWNSIQFSNGKVAEPPIATCEVQGYVYDAKARMSEIAKEVWKDDSLSKKLRDEANELKEIFNERYWIEDRGYYAVALDKNKNQVDSLTSNNGHLLWSGIADQDKAASVARMLLDESLFSGYGIRTLSTKDKGYSPIGYNTGCVWAHDNSLIAEGLARYGFAREANTVIDAVLSAAPFFAYTLPETFAGFPKMKMGFPVRYPTSSSPQAWAAGATFLFLKTLLGIEPMRNQKKIQISPILSEDDTFVDLEGMKAFGNMFSIFRSRDGQTKVQMNASQG